MKDPMYSDDFREAIFGTRNATDLSLIKDLSNVMDDGLDTRPYYLFKPLLTYAKSDEALQKGITAITGEFCRRNALKDEETRFLNALFLADGDTLACGYRITTVLDRTVGECLKLGESNFECNIEDLEFNNSGTSITLDGFTAYMNYLESLFHRT